MFTQDLIDEDDNAATTERKPVAMPAPIQSDRKEASAVAPNGNMERGTIEQVARKTGDGKKGAWTKFGVLIGGAWYSTFDVTLGEKAEALEGRVVDLAYKIDGKFKTILDLVEVSEAAQPAAQATNDTAALPGANDDPIPF
jgi:hypothetical protein